MNNHQELVQEKPGVKTWKHQPIPITINVLEIISDIKKLIAQRS
tara:strand:+ start:191 stop:322 length:132 start_codon:yes stop_codon:yes gene_type:complete